MSKTVEEIMMLLQQTESKLSEAIEQCNVNRDVYTQDVVTLTELAQRLKQFNKLFVRNYLKGTK